MNQQNKRIINIIAIVGLLLFSLVSSIKITEAQTATTLSVNPATVTANNNSDNFELAVEINGVTDLWGWELNVTYDSQYIAMTKLPIEGDFMQSSHNTLFTPGVLNSTSGLLKGGPSNVLLTSDGVSGDGTLVILTFRVLKPVVSTTITINASSLISNHNPSADMLFNTPVSPYPSPTYTTATVSYLPTDGTPIAHAGQNQTVNQFTKVTLDASQSMPQDAAEQTYTWTFTDNETRTLTGKTAEYTFIWPGTFPITLTVTNSHGTSTAVIGITVKSITPPVIIITADGYNGQSAPVNQIIYFNANQSYDPYNLPLVGGYQWDFGDGQTSLEVTTSHKYSNPGTYTVSLTRSNSAGLSATGTKTIIVGDGASSTAGPDATDSPSATNTPQPSSPTATSGGNNQQSTQAFSLPPTILYPLIFATVFAIGGSAFWLRKKE